MKHRAVPVLLFCWVSLVSLHPARAQQPKLEAALGDLYATCLFEPVANNPFSQAATLAREALAPGITNFIESNLASIPLTPPSLDVEYAGGEIVTVVSGFTPVYTENSATVGAGQFLVGSNFSHYSLSKIRGENLSNLSFSFRQNNGGDRINATMPFNVDASVFTLFGTYGVTNRLDIGIALPIVQLKVENVNTTFSIEGNQSRCRYGQTLNCNGQGVREVSPALGAFQEEFPESETTLSTVALRAKYRFPVGVAAGKVAAVFDMRLPVGSANSILGRGHFGSRVMLIAEYNQLTSFTPYLNVGTQFWNGTNPNSLRFATGFSQRMASSLFFAFDLLGELDLEDSPFLASIDQPSGEATGAELALASSSIPSLERDHTLNAALGLQYAFSPTFQLYGSALFALLDRGLHSNVVPTAGVSLYF